MSIDSFTRRSSSSAESSRLRLRSSRGSAGEGIAARIETSVKANEKAKAKAMILELSVATELGVMAPRDSVTISAIIARTIRVGFTLSEITPEVS